MCALRKTASPMPAVRISPTTHRRLQDLARDENRPMGEIITDLVTRYEDEQFWKNYREGYRRLRADPVAWQDYQDELADWDQLSGDGLEDEPPYFTPDEEARERRAATEETGDR